MTVAGFVGVGTHVPPTSVSVTAQEVVLGVAVVFGTHLLWYNVLPSPQVVVVAGGVEDEAGGVDAGG